MDSPESIYQASDPSEYKGPSIYVDGTGSEEVGIAAWGMAVFDYGGTYVESASGVAVAEPKTSHIAEIAAALRAVEYCGGSAMIVHDNPCIYRLAVGENEPKYPICRKYQQAIQEHPFDLTFCEVDSHSGVFGNELADTLAWNARVLAQRETLPQKLKPYPS